MIAPRVFALTMGNDQISDGLLNGLPLAKKNFTVIETFKKSFGLMREKCLIGHFDSKSKTLTLCKPSGLRGLYE